MKLPPITDEPEHALHEPWRLEGADDIPTREIHSATGWHLATITPSGAMGDNGPLFELLRAAPELAHSLRAVLDLIDRSYLEFEDEDDLTDVGILETAYELLRRIDQ